MIAETAAGDRLAAALVAGLRALRPAMELVGQGGAALRAEGLREGWPLPGTRRYGILPSRRPAAEVARALRGSQPDLLLVTEAQGLGRTVARALGQGPTRRVHFAESGVDRSLRDAADGLLLPWEGLGEAGALPSAVVGHPAVEEPSAGEPEVRAFRGAFGIGEAPLLLVLPPPEEAAQRLLPLWAEALALLAAARPALRVVVPDATPALKAAVADWPGRPVALAARVDPLARGTRRAALGAADAALAAEAAESLWLAPGLTPLVLARDPSRLPALFAPAPPPVPLDALEGARLVPDLSGPACRPEAVAAALGAVLDDPAPQREAMRRALPRLGAGSAPPSARAARAILGML